MLSAIVTGGNTGMGLATAVELCRRGFAVTISARSDDKAREAIAAIEERVPGAQISYLCMELKSLTSVRRFAEQYIVSGKPLDLLVNNAGIMNTPYEMTEDGFEAQFQVNHLSHFLLTHYLLPLLRQSKEGGRVVNLSSRAHMRWSEPVVDHLDHVRTVTSETYDGWRYYGLSKLCNILFTRSLFTHCSSSSSHNLTNPSTAAADSLETTPLTTADVLFFALHPGLVDTQLLNTAPGLSTHAISIDEGIRTALFLSTYAPRDELKSGEYYYRERVMHREENAQEISSQAVEERNAEYLWMKSLEYVGLTEDTYGV